VPSKRVKAQDPDRRSVKRHPLAAISCEMQRQVLELNNAKVPFNLIRHHTKLPEKSILAIIEHGIITPQYVNVWKCMRCGAKIETAVCMACEVRQMKGMKC